MDGGVRDLVWVARSVVTRKRGTRLHRQAVAIRIARLPDVDQLEEPAQLLGSGLLLLRRSGPCSRRKLLIGLTHKAEG